jgi:hypothetical protein
MTYFLMSDYEPIKEEPRKRHVKKVLKKMGR